MKVLVYDNQDGYFEFLKDVIADKNLEGLQCVKHAHSPQADCEVLFFFLQSDFELLDFLKLYREDMQVVFGCCTTKQHSGRDLTGQDTNMYFLDLSCHRQQLASEVTQLLSIFTGIDKKNLA